MSSPTPPPSVPPVPYGPSASSPGTSGDGSFGVTPAAVLDLRGHPAVKWGLRVLVTIVLRIILRALFRR